MRARGGVNWVTILLLLLLVGGGYLAWTYIPVFIVHYEVKQVVHDYINQAVKNPEDEAQIGKMLHKLRTLDQLEVLDDDGNLVEVPTVQVQRGDVTWERDMNADPPTLRISFEYTRPVQYPLLDRSTEMTLTVDVTGDLSMPDWGPAR